MKYSYAYKTSDGVRHEASVEASSREHAFEALRAQGIKPIKVVAADGSKANGEVRGVRKRVVTAIAACVAVAVGTIAYFVGESASQTANSPNEALVAPRHQIYGDPAIMEEMDRTGFASVFEAEGDRLLALYAVPGRVVVDSRSEARQCKALEDCVGQDVRIAPDDSREVAELKRIVQGMKEELRWYLADGVGTCGTYVRRLRERQDEEVRIYERMRNELESVTDPAVRDRQNAALRAMGLRTIPRPKNAK